MGVDTSLPLPLAGLHRAAPFRDQPPTTTADCVNMRADGGPERRSRLATRPGLGREPYRILGETQITGTIDSVSYDSGAGTSTVTATAAVFTPAVQSCILDLSGDSGSKWLILSFTSTSVIVVDGDASADDDKDFVISVGDPVMMLANLPTQDISDSGSWADGFNDDSSGEVSFLWNSNAYFTDGVPLVRSGRAYAALGEFRGALRTLIDFDVTDPWTIELYCQIYNGVQLGTYAAYFGIAESGTDVDNGWKVELGWDYNGIDHANNEQYIRLYSGNGTTWTAVATVQLARGVRPSAGTLKIKVDPTASTGTIKVYWWGVLVIDYNHSSYNFTGRRLVGFSIDHKFDAGAAYPLNRNAEVESFSIRYTPTVTTDPPPNVLCAVAGGRFYRQGDDGDMTMPTTGSSITLQSDRQIDAVAFNGVLYIADHGPVKLSGTAGVITHDAGGDYLTNTGITDWTSGTYDLDAAEDVLVIENTDLAGIIGFSFSGTVSRLLFDRDLLTTGSQSSVTWRIERGPKKFNPNTDTLSLWKTVTTSEYGDNGFVPAGCPLIELYRNRIVLAGADAAPNVIQMSRQNDPVDWNYGADENDLGRAVASDDEATEAGTISEGLTAIVAQSNDYLTIATANRIYRLVGDYNYGGQINVLSTVVGIVARKAWCVTPESLLIALTSDGLYSLSPGPDVFPQPWSRDILPADLLINAPTQYHASMCFDTRERGIHISMTEKDKGAGIHYWISWHEKSFWPIRYTRIDFEPTVMLALPAVGVSRGSIIFGSRDGRLRRYVRGTSTDDGEAFLSSIVVGPFRLGGDDHFEGSIDTLDAVCGEEIGNSALDFGVYTAKTAEEAIANTTGTADATGAFGPGDNYAYPVYRGSGAVAIKLHNATSELPWSIERLNAMVSRLGPQRK